MKNFSYKDYCVGLTIGFKFPQKFLFEDKLGEISDYFIEKCSFKQHQKIETSSGVRLQVKKDLMEIVMERDNFIGNYSYFYGDQIIKKLYPGKKVSDFKVKLPETPFVYRTSYEQTKNDFKNVYIHLFRYFKNLVHVKKLNRIGMVHHFMIFYDDIKFQYTESLKTGANLSFAENHYKVAKNQYKYAQNDLSWKNAIIEYSIKDQEFSKLANPFGKLSLDMQTYHEPESVSIDKLGGEENIVNGLFDQTYEFINKSRLFDLKKERNPNEDHL